MAVHPSINLPLNFLSLINQPRKSDWRVHTVSIRTLKFFANRLPTNILSDTANRIINLAGDLVTQSTYLRDEYSCEQWRKRRVKQLLVEMEQASSLVEYEKCTNELDMLQGHDVWKAQRESVETAYNPEIIEDHLKKLRKAAKEGELDAMLHLLRTSLSRDLGGMSMLRLYKHTWFGTKYLIDDYIETAVETIDRFLEVAGQCNLSTAEASRYQTSLEDALKYFGRSALTLSGGAVLGMKHIGVVKALWEVDLLPEIISGASAGSIVAAITGGSTDEELEMVLEHFPNSDLAVFDDPGTGTHGLPIPVPSMLSWPVARLLTMFQKGAWFDIANLERVMKSWLKDLTFREAHYKTGRVLNICVSSAESSEPRILNYITAPDVYIWSAVCASCSVPSVFKAATIYEKDPVTKERKTWMKHSQQLFVDGSLDHDIPMRKLSEMFNVNFFLVSQVNPHVRIFLEPEETFDGVQPPKEYAKLGLYRSMIRFGKGVISLGRDELLLKVQQAADMGVCPESFYRMSSVLKQQYTGDINILPDIDFREYLSMMANPTAEYMRRATVIGEKATWPKMCRIKNSVAIELALIRAIHALRGRVNFSDEAREARQAARGSIRGRSRSVRGGRPSFLRRRSLSNDYSAAIATIATGEGPPSPLPMRVIRRNASAGSLIERLGKLTSKEPKELAPQSGIGEDSSTQSEDSLNMILQVPCVEPSVTTTSSGIDPDGSPGTPQSLDGARPDPNGKAREHAAS